MKKLLIGLIGAGLSFGALADSHTMADVQAQLEDRVSGTYRLEVIGYRVDGGVIKDFEISKEHLDYLPYGVLSHRVIQCVNESFGQAGNQALDTLGLPPIYQGGQ